MNRGNRRVIVVAVAGVLLIAIVIALSLPRRAPQSSSTNSNKTAAMGPSVSYTDAITNQPAGDFTDRTPEIVTHLPNVQINGIEKLYATYLSDEQAVQARVIITNYLQARAGDTPVQATIADKTINLASSNNSLQFTLVSLRPVIRYLVTITVADQSGTVVPTVTFKQQEQ
jgi:hypothetical protein